MTVRDSIEKASFVGLGGYRNEDTGFSPDGRHFFVVTERGVLDSNQREATLWLFETASVLDVLKHSATRHRPDPRALVKINTMTNDYAPITDVRWASDSENIAFLGRNTKDSEKHLFEVDIREGRVKELSPDGYNVEGFDRAANDTFIFTVTPTVPESEAFRVGGPKLPDIQLGTGLPLFDLLYPNRRSWCNVVRTVWQVRNGKASLVIDPATSEPIVLTGFLTGSGEPLSLAPSGRYAVVTTVVQQAPASWESYETGEGEYRFLRIVPRKPNIGRAVCGPTQYQLLDLQSGRMSVLIDAPLGRDVGIFDLQLALWSRDEKRVVLSNTFLPLTGNGAADLPPSKRPWVVAVDISSGKISSIRENAKNNRGSGVHLTSMEWHLADQQLVLRYFDRSTSTALQPELFQWESGSWKAVTDAAAVHTAENTSARREFSISVRQSVNEPPVLVATDAKTGASERLWDPNPQFAGIKFGEATVYKWRDKAGREWTGGLVKPPDYVAGRRYPLVIQTHGFNPNEFLINGAYGYTTTMAARALAARGILVLQVGEISIPSDEMATPSETAYIEDGYISAIKQLETDALVKSQRVGITGFSHTGWYVLNSLIHAGKYFAAATLGDASTMSYGEDLVIADNGQPQWTKEMASSIGAEPFGAGLQKWISDSPAFNSDKIQVPLLIEPHGPPLLISMWEMYAALRLQKKPVELLYIRSGSHILEKPLEILASEEMTVDWYDFWLNEHEDPDPAKADQYARWRKLRLVQEANTQSSK